MAQESPDGGYCIVGISVAIGIVLGALAAIMGKWVDILFTFH